MTRENKAGLVVSCSFLCLVGTVLALKLREPASPDKSTAVAEGKKPPPIPDPSGDEQQKTSLTGGPDSPPPPPPGPGGTSVGGKTAAESGQQVDGTPTGRPATAPAK